MRENLGDARTHSHVPIIDFGGSSTAAVARAALGAEMLGAMKDIGFVTLVNHGLSRELACTAHAEMAKFFALPAVAKRKRALVNPASNRGYVGMEQEILDYETADLKEAFNVGDEHETAHRNHWPEPELPRL